MTDNGDIAGRRRSGLEDLAGVSAGAGGAPESDGPSPGGPVPEPVLEPDGPGPGGPAPGGVDPVAARREFARVLGEFRRSAVLVPFDELGSLWTADFGGVRWICAFSDEEALARFAVARGEAGREWPYRTVLGARLLDAMVPLLPGPGGVALDAGSADGRLFPPVAGIVPEGVAVDLGGAR